jgi:hypothetical protein
MAPGSQFRSVSGWYIIHVARICEQCNSVQGESATIFNASSYISKHSNGASTWESVDEQDGMKIECKSQAPELQEDELQIIPRNPQRLSRPTLTTTSIEDNGLAPESLQEARPPQSAKKCNRIHTFPSHSLTRWSALSTVINTTSVVFCWETPPI